MLALIHSIFMFVPWLIVIFIRNPRILLLAIIVNFLIVVQHNVLGRCILTQYETNGQYPIFNEWLAKQMGLEIRDFNKGWTLVMNAAPTVAMGSLLFGILSKRTRVSSSRHYR